MGFLYGCLPAIKPQSALRCEVSAAHLYPALIASGLVAQAC